MPSLSVINGSSSLVNTTYKLTMSSFDEQTSAVVLAISNKFQYCVFSRNWIIQSNARMSDLFGPAKTPEGRVVRDERSWIEWEQTVSHGPV